MVWPSLKVFKAENDRMGNPVWQSGTVTCVTQVPSSLPALGDPSGVCAVAGEVSTTKKASMAAVAKLIRAGDCLSIEIPVFVQEVRSSDIAVNG